MENKHKHLEFIQNIITRMAGNSFLLKGWSVTIICALLSLSAAQSNTKFALISYFPIIIFWLLDSYYLFQERCYRKLYSSVKDKNDNDINYSLDASVYETLGDFACSALSKTILPFHFVILGGNCIILFFIK